MIEKMIEGLNRLHPMSAELIDAIKVCTIINEYPKKTIILKEGQVASYACFILKGLTRAYYISGGNETTRLFMDEGYVVTSWVSFQTRQPSNEFLETLEDSLLACIHYDDLQKLYHEFAEFNMIGRKLVEHFFVRSEQRTFMLRKQTAEEKYEFFIQHYPDLFQRVSQRYIATFLGMKEETLSRVRAKALKKS
jgi:CRP-like cAMP-binding protein